MDTGEIDIMIISPKSNKPKCLCAFLKMHTVKKLEDNRQVFK